MALPSADDTSASMIRGARFSVSRIKANAKAKPLAKGVADALADLLAAVAQRNEADDATLDADAQHDFALENLEDALGRFQNRLIGLEEQKNGPQQKRIIGKPLSTLFATPKGEQLAVFGGIASRTNTAASSTEAKKAGQEYVASFKEFQASEKAIAAAHTAFVDAQKKEQGAKKLLVVAMVRVQGQLLDLFAEDRGRVTRFFLKGAKPAKAKSKGTGGAAQPAA